jgi:disulfide bond formation protein DsbB
MTARQGNLLGFAACAGLLAYAYYAQFVLHLEPCPLCIFQRIGVLAIGLVFLSAAAATIGVSLRHLYIQSLPPGSIPACGASLNFMLQVFSLNEVVTKVLSGSGECAKISWRFLGLAMPGWVLIAAVSLGAFGLWTNLRHRPPVLRF